MLCVVDEFTREALAIRVGRRLASSDVIDVLADLFLAHPRARVRGLRLQHRPGAASTASPLGEWAELHRRRVRRLARQQRHAAHPRRALPSADPGQDRALAPDPEKTASCSRTTICPAISRRRSPLSSSTTITAAPTRACRTSPRPMSTSAADPRSCVSDNASSVRPSNAAACCTSSRPHNLQPR